MKTLFAVTLIKGKGWDAAKPMRSQAQWNEHAALMDQLTADGIILLGGPIGDGEDKVLLVFDTADENEIYSVLADDPWLVLQIREIDKIQRWTIFLQAEQKIKDFSVPASPG